MKVRKCILFIIVLVALTVSSLPISFAVNPSVVTADMPEPVADDYNKYIVVNDLLIWVSYQVDYVYTVMNPTESVWYTKNLTAYEEYSGSYDGEYQQAPYQAAGTIHDQNNIQGVVDVVIVPDSSYYPSEYEDISIQNNGNGTITYADAELALTKVGQTEISQAYNLQCQILDNDSIRIRFRKNQKFNTAWVCDFTYYCNLIYIPTGECINRVKYSVVDSTFQTYQFTVNINEINEDYEENGYIVTFQPYGFVCLNEANIDLDRPLIIWNTNSNWDSYFLNTMLFVEEIWRNIVDVTSPVEPDTTARWGENLSNDSPQNELNVQPDGQEIALTQALNNINFSPQNKDKFEQWAGMFSNSKLIACCVFALACGSVILTLGKKKSE